MTDDITDDDYCTDEEESYSEIDDSDNEEIDCDSDDDMPDRWGMAFALADEIGSAEKIGKYDMNDKTDRENFEQAMKYNPYSSGEPLPDFERVISDICSGRRSLFDTDY